MKKVLITGGAGFIGSHCADLFLAHGYQVGVFDLKTKEEAVNLTHVMDNITYVEGDVRNLAQLTQVLAGYEYVLHLAAIVSVQDSILDPIGTHATNVTGTLNVLQAAVDNDIEHVVYASSAAVYGDTQVVPTPEDAPLLPLSPYGLHKVYNEGYARLYNLQYNLTSTGLRFFNVYGSRQDPGSPYSGVISIFCKKMQEGERPFIYGDGNATRDFIHVSDVAQECLRALQTSECGACVRNVGTGQALTINSLIEHLNTILLTTIEPVFNQARLGDIVHSCAVVQKKDPEGKTVDLHTGLKETLGLS